MIDIQSEEAYPMNGPDLRLNAFPSLSRFLGASSSPVILTDMLAPDQPIVFANPAFEAMTGYRESDIVGYNCRLLQGNDRNQPARAGIAAALAAGRPYECELRNYRRDGSMFWNRLYLFPLRNDDGQVTHFAGIQHDVSDEKASFAQVETLAAERARLIERLERSRHHMARLSHDLINAQEHERKALARELHDEFAQRVTALQLILHRAHPSFELGGMVPLWQEAIDDLTSLVRLMRGVSASLRPPGLDHFGLEPTLRHMLMRQFANGPSWDFDYAGTPARLPPVVEVSAYRIIQEAVTNILRHARATRVRVRIACDAAGTVLELAVRDDGAGFDASRWREHGMRDKRAGLTGICERIELLGGRFDVSSRPGRGTTITATLPLAPPAAETTADE
jgi:PAS domain S-box-containing protein